LRNFPTYMDLLGTYTFINFHKIFCLLKHKIGLNGRFRFFGLEHRIMLGHTCLLFPNSNWFATNYTHFGPKSLFLCTKYSYLHVYLVPTRLLIFSNFSHLHVYLVYTFIQYHRVRFKLIENLCFSLQPIKKSNIRFHMWFVY